MFKEKPTFYFEIQISSFGPSFLEHFLEVQLFVFRTYLCQTFQV